MLDGKQTYALLTMGATLALFTVGCKASGQKADPLAASDYPPGRPASTAYQGHAQSPVPAIAATPLPPVQQASTARQEYCPVTGAKLGSMGTPIPVAIGSQTVYVCCAGCVEKLRQNPEQYLGSGLSTSARNERQVFAASNKRTGSSTDQPEACGGGSCGTTGSSSSRTGSCGGSCCH